MVGGHLYPALHLAAVVIARAVKLQPLPDFFEREAEAATLTDQLDPRSLGRAIVASAANFGGRDQLQILVIAQGARRYVEQRAHFF